MKHHLIPLSKQREFNYSLDVSANIVSLCQYATRFTMQRTWLKPIIKHLLNARLIDLMTLGLELV